MTESSVQPFSALVARLHPRAGFAQISAAFMAIVLLSACASSPWYDTPPYMPAKVSPPEGTVVTPETTVIFAWDVTDQAGVLTRSGPLILRNLTRPSLWSQDIGS